MIEKLYGGKSHENVMVLWQPVFLNCTILKILNTFESLTSSSVSRLWPSKAAQKQIKTTQNARKDDIVADKVFTDL